MRKPCLNTKAFQGIKPWNALFAHVLPVTFGNAPGCAAVFFRDLVNGCHVHYLLYWRFARLFSLRSSFGTGWTFPLDRLLQLNDSCNGCGHVE